MFIQQLQYTIFDNIFVSARVWSRGRDEARRGREARRECRAVRAERVRVADGHPSEDGRILMTVRHATRGERANGRDAHGPACGETQVDTSSRPLQL